MLVGLFFGSFNPIHNGHLIIAQHLLNELVVDQIWIIVSPHNPLKEKSSLAKDYDRLHLVRLATEDNPKIKVSNIEFNLPKPSYTIDTLTHLKEKYPEQEFALIMGEIIWLVCQNGKTTNLFFVITGFWCIKDPATKQTLSY